MTTEANPVRPRWPKRVKARSSKHGADQPRRSGVGLGLAVLLPATMKLLGERNWYMPRWLDWVPRLTPEDAEKQPPLRPLAH